jgi:mannosyltransferase OCH1-like enzyme
MLHSWQALHPGWQVRVWRDAEVERLTSFPAVQMCSDPKQKADIARYEILWLHGGVYLDLDFEAIQPLDALLDAAPGVVCHESAPPVDQHSLSNGFFAFVPQHPAMWRAMRFAQRAKANTPFVHLMTGPRMLRLAIGDELPTLLRLPTASMYPVTFGGRQALAGMKCQEQPCAQHFPGSFAVHIWSLLSDPEPALLHVQLLADAAQAHNKQWGVAPAGF